jgi:hypothetical protein
MSDEQYADRSIRFVENTIQTTIPDCQFRVLHASGGIFAEVVSPALVGKRREELLTQLVTAVLNDSMAQADWKQRIVITRLLAYEKQGAQFRTEATLYTRETETDGVHTTVTLTSQDARVLLAEIDVEALLYGHDRPFVIRAISADANVMALRQNAGYQQLAVSGGFFGVQKVEPVDGCWKIVLD